MTAVGDVGGLDGGDPVDMPSWVNWAAVPEDASWAADVSTRIKTAVVSGGRTELSMKPPPGQGGVGAAWGSGAGVLEAYGRAYAGATGIDLGMVLPTLLAATSFCTQGAWWVPLEKGMAGTDEIPLVFQFFGVAPSGQQKSSLLERRVLPVLDELSFKGTLHRNELCLAWKEAARAAVVIGAGGSPLVLDDKVWDEIYGAGRCAHSIADAGTPEGLRGDLAGNGGHVGIFTTEPDVLREIRAYAKDDGSLTIFVRGWDQSNILTSRARGTVRMAECSVPFAILTQPETFTEYTRPGPDGHDPYLSRGVFSRAWLYEAPYLKAGTGSGHGLLDTEKDALTEMVAMSAVLWEEKMRGLVAYSDEYRAGKGVMQAWLGRPECWGEVPAPTSPKSLHRKLGLDAAGQTVYLGVQWIRQDLIQLSDEMDAEGPGMRAKFASWFARFTEHVLRIAALLTLADNPEAEVIDAAVMQDVAVRWMPWLMAAWVRVTTARGVVNAEEAVATEVLANPSQMDLTVESNVLRALLSVFEAQHKQGPKYKGPDPEDGLTVSEIAQRVRKYSIAFSRPGAYPNLVSLLGTKMPEMAENGQFVRLGVPTAPDAVGMVRQRYTLNKAGGERAAAEARKREKKQGGDPYYHG